MRILRKAMECVEGTLMYGGSLFYLKEKFCKKMRGQ